MNDRMVAKFCYERVRKWYGKEAGVRDSVSSAVSGAATRVNESLRDPEFVKKLLRTAILGTGGAAIGGLGGSLFKTKGVTYDRYGRPKRKTRAGLGALLGGAGGATVGLLANPKLPYENQITR